MKLKMTTEQALEIVKTVTVADTFCAESWSEHTAMVVLSTEIEKLRRLVKAAPKFFAPLAEFDGAKLDWIKEAEHL